MLTGVILKVHKEKFNLELLHSTLNFFYIKLFFYFLTDAIKIFVSIAVFINFGLAYVKGTWEGIHR